MQGPQLPEYHCQRADAGVERAGIIKRISAADREGALERWIVRTVLLVILAASLLLWEKGRDVYFLGSDDLIFINRSRAIAGGDWGRLLEPQGPHVLPLFALIRLYGDLGFPGRYQSMHHLTIAAHLAAVILLFALSRRYFQTAATALFAAALFAWQALGGEAFLIRSQSTFVLSLPFLLAGLYLLLSMDHDHPVRSAAGGCLCLSLAVGLHSLAAVAALPGVILGYHLLGRSRETRRSSSDALAWTACAAPLLIGGAAWIRWGLPALNDEHRAQLPAIRDQLLGRTLDALHGVILHYGYIVRRLEPTRLVLTVAVLGLLALLLALRKEPGGRWIVTILALTVGPLFLSLLLRTQSGFSISRYAYQTFLAVAVAAGAALDLFLAKMKNRPLVAIGVILLLAAAAPLYYRSQQERWSRILTSLEEMQTKASLYRGYWMGWQSFFDQVAASGEVRLPPLTLDTRWTLADAFELCNRPRNSHIKRLSPQATNARDCLDFWRLVERVKQRPSPFDAVPLPLSLAVVDFHRPLPHGDHVWCQAAAVEAEPIFILRK